MKERDLIIIGASGHGRVVSDIAISVGYKKIYFLDDADIPEMNVIGKVMDYTKYVDEYDFFIAIGNNKTRESIFKKLIEQNANIISLISPNAVVSNSALIGKGVVIMAGSVINNGAKICDGAIINTCSSVDHDCHIGDFVHIAVGSHLAGTVNVGEKTLIGAGATVINNINICDECIIGSGAVIVSDIYEKGTYVGIPAKKM